ncbi:MAG: hypothetical protein H7641_07795, partial [Candidatus Heimdallarchaeota archaeon]|nr:hypothetical protein [Candidatus Heimdallarchaeota archaeon]MCK4877465.1 hypothetical protein [Candidatus Heimdallarchaeota archaeon]
DWFESELTTGSNNTFHLSLVSYGYFYTAEFSVNETISESSFVSISLEEYYFTEYHVLSYENATYYIFDEFSDVFYIEDTSRFGYDYSITGRITIITEFENTLSTDIIEFKRGVESYSFYSASAYVFENGSYVVSYTSSISTKEVPDYHFLGKSIIAMNIYSDLSLLYPEQPILFGLKNYSAFAYFWLKYWYAFAVPIIVLGLAYAIFHKRINRGIRKLKAFLLRPIIADASKTKLVFTNIWLFFLNASSLILVLWRTNKKRLAINLLGFTILATIIIASSSLYDSKRNSLVYDYISNYDIYDNGITPVYFSIPSTGVTIGDLTKNITETAIEEIVNSIERNTVLFSRIITGYQYSLQSSIGFQIDLDLFAENYGYTNSYNSLLDSLLDEGSLPDKSGEILITSYIETMLGLHVGDIIDLPFSEKNITIAGIINVPSYSVLSSLCKELNLPKDPVAFLTNHYSALVPVDHFFEIYENVSSVALSIMGNIQFSYDFSDISPSEISVLNEELETLESRSPYSFSLLPQSFWDFRNEFAYAFYGIETTLATAQILVLFILVPIIYLAWFLIFEVNELFGLSFEQEIRILRSKGVSTGNISFIYLSMKTMEAIISALIGFLLTLAILPPLIRVDKFLEFKQTPARISFTSVPISISITLVLLLAISFPRIVRMSKAKKKIQKTPRRLVRLLKNLRLNYIFIIILGGIIAGIGFWLFSLFAFGFAIPGIASFALIFVYLMGIGVMIALLGVGLLMKDIHKILMIVLSKISWKAKKTKFSLSLVDVRSDIN